MKSLTASEDKAVRQNLFPESAAAALSREDFPWHRDGSGEVTAAMRQSSQALAIDVFGVLTSLKEPSRIVDAWLGHCGLSLVGPWKPWLERSVPGPLLGEPVGHRER
jgi:hypothetical protein